MRLCAPCEAYNVAAKFSAPRVAYSLPVLYGIFLQANGQHTCEATFQAGSPKCKEDPRNDRSCSDGPCREHCCLHHVSPDCPACDDTGKCYEPLALKPGWEDIVNLDTKTGWIPRINQVRQQLARAHAGVNDQGAAK